MLAWRLKLPQPSCLRYDIGVIHSQSYAEYWGLRVLRFQPSGGTTTARPFLQAVSTADGWYHHANEGASGIGQQ